VLLESKSIARKGASKQENSPLKSEKTKIVILLDTDARGTRIPNKIQYATLPAGVLHSRERIPLGQHGV